MANITGTSNSEPLNGTAGGVADTISGGRGNDVLSGFSGNDVLLGGRGDDTLIGGAGSDVLTGGVGGDVFRWSAGHVTNGSTDYVTDFDIRSYSNGQAGTNTGAAFNDTSSYATNQHDKLEFLDSSGAQLLVLGVSHGFRSETTANNVDLQNSAKSEDITFLIQNSLTGARQEIVLLDAYSTGLADTWNTYLQQLQPGLAFSNSVSESPSVLV